MGHGLRICCDPVVIFCCKIDIFGAQARKNPLDLSTAVSGISVFDDDLPSQLSYDCGRAMPYQGLTLRFHTRSVQRMTGNNIDVRRQVSLEGRHFRCFTRSLTAYDCVFLRSYCRISLRIKSWSSGLPYIDHTLQRLLQCARLPHYTRSNRWSGRRGDHLQGLLHCPGQLPSASTWH